MDDRVAIRCVLAKHHDRNIDHTDIGVHAGKPCGAVIRYEERAAEEVTPVAQPLTLDGVWREPAGTREEHGQRVAEEAPRARMYDRSEPVVLGGEEPLRADPAEMVAQQAEPAPSPPTPPEPTTADLIRAVETDTERALLREEEEQHARERRIVAKTRMSESLSALAKHIGRGKFVKVGDVTYRSVPPRKPKGGGVAEDALWRLEPVEVAR